VALAIHHAVTPKAPWLATRGVDFEWPVAGLPDFVHVDNGVMRESSPNRTLSR